jgi:hypothetical protein
MSVKPNKSSAIKLETISVTHRRYAIDSLVEMNQFGSPHLLTERAAL